MALSVTKEVTDNKITYNVTGNGKLTLETSNTYADRNIEVNITAEGGTSFMYTVEELVISVPAVNAHSYTSNKDYTFTPPTGYKAVGVVGWRSSNYRIVMSTAYINSDGNVNATFVNHTASNVTSTITARVEVLCVKQ